MKSTVVALALVAAFVSPAIAEPVAYSLDKSHSNLAISYNHLGYSITDGRFGDWDADLVIDVDDPTKSKVDVQINIDSLDTFWPERDTHLKGPDFFDVAEHPEATFKTTSVEQTGEKELSVSGDLTIKGITKPVVLEVVVNTVGEHPMAKKPAVGFNASTVIKRSDFGMDKFVPYVGDDVSISFSGEALAAE